MTFKSTITNDQLKSIIRDCDPKTTGAGKWEPISTDSLWQLAFELFQFRCGVTSGYERREREMNLLGKLKCWWEGRHLHGKPAFALPPTDETNRHINDHLCIMECPRCGGHYMRHQH